MSVLLKKPSPFLTSLGMSAFFTYLYEQTLDGKIGI